MASPPLRSGGKVALSPSDFDDEFFQEDHQREEERKKNAAHNRDVNDWIPDEYMFNPLSAEPMLHYLRKVPEDASLRRLLKAATEDVRLHNARIRAGLAKDKKIIKTYTFETDESWKERQERREKRTEAVTQLKSQARDILDQLDVKAKQGLTQSERTQIRLARWQRVLELYVYCPDEANIDLLGLLDKLLQGCAEEEEMSEVLNEASQMCSSLVELTSLAVRDATEDAAESDDAYQIRLEAHNIFARNAALQAEDIQTQFRTNGRAALQIGQQLEYAEGKRRQCESAIILIRRWGEMEKLAESEASRGDELKINEEIRGAVPHNSCILDSLYTRPDQSLEASKVLKQLRAVVKARANSTAGAIGDVDPNSSRRFMLTANLIERISKALEARLLNSFTQIYSAGGQYDFSENAGHGCIDWKELRHLAQALMLFEYGRRIQKKFVHMVTISRFPELFQAKKPSDIDDDEFDMDATRSLLSGLFHRVSDVCTAEFELIAHVFGPAPDGDPSGASEVLSEDMPLQVARALLQRVISDKQNGLQSRINGLLASIDRRGDFHAGAAKLDTFVVIHEKAAGLFHLLKEASKKMVISSGRFKVNSDGQSVTATSNAEQALVQFLTTQEAQLSGSHRRGYLNLELRLLNHECYSPLDQLGFVLLKGEEKRTYDRPRVLESSGTETIIEEFHAPTLPLCVDSLKQKGFKEILSGILKQSVLRQPLIRATDSLARARLMFGSDSDDTARVITAIYNQMCSFYGDAFLYPLIESLGEMLSQRSPVKEPQLPFDENVPPHDLGVENFFWVSIERIHSAIKAFDRELWAENRAESGRVWDILKNCDDVQSIQMARERRASFFVELERKGNEAIARALETLSTHIRWILVTGGESMLATGGNRILHHITGQSGGPYAVPAGSSLDAPNSPAVKSLCYCLRGQFVHIQAALTPESLSTFWTALSIRLYDILVSRILAHYYVSTVGAVILGRDVDALRGVALLAGRNHSHWDNLRELVTLYMTPPDALKAMLVGRDGDINSGKGLFAAMGRDQSIVFMSRRVDYRYKTTQGFKKSGWAMELLNDLGVNDPTDGNVNIALFSAENQKSS